jgi:hypothetical protein
MGMKSGEIPTPTYYLRDVINPDEIDGSQGRREKRPFNKGELCIDLFRNSYQC